MYDPRIPFRRSIDGVPSLLYDTTRMESPNLPNSLSKSLSTVLLSVNILQRPSPIGLCLYLTSIQPAHPS